MGGTHEDGFKPALPGPSMIGLSKTSIIKDTEKIDGSDIREGLTALSSVKIPEDKLEYRRPNQRPSRNTPERPAVTRFIYDNTGSLLHGRT
jgi:topoisomerase-4 subunit B